jgi:Ca2+/H+ antiporter
MKLWSAVKAVPSVLVGIVELLAEEFAAVFVFVGVVVFPLVLLWMFFHTGH